MSHLSVLGHPSHAHKMREAWANLPHLVPSPNSSPRPVPHMRVPSAPLDNHTTPSSSSSSSAPTPAVGVHEEKKLRPTPLRIITTPPEAQSIKQSDRFVVHRSLSKSLFGEVFLATDKTLGGKLVAVKVSQRQLLQKHTSTRGYFVMENTQQEARIMRQLQEAGGHRHVLKLHDEIEDKHTHSLVMEFARHGDLFDLVSAHPTSEERARFFFRQILSGVEYIHSQGIAHLDLSLENILIAEGGVVKICDFGVAQVADVDTTLHFPADYKPGKVRYQAPEVHASLEFNPHKADVFSLGVILFLLCTKSNPFEVPASSDVRFDMISTGRLPELLQAVGFGKLLSADALDLLQNMLLPEEKRFTLKQVLAHRWLSPSTSVQQQ